MSNSYKFYGENSEVMNMKKWLEARGGLDDLVRGRHV